VANHANHIWKAVLRKLRTIIIAGLVVVVPIGLTVWIMVWIFEGIENLIQPLVIGIFGRTYPGVGFGVTIVLILIVGVIMTNVVGRRAVHWGEAMLGKVPVIRRIYVALKEISQSFSDPAANGFMHVVLVDFPYKGMKAIGFITNEETDKSGRKLITVFIPNAPNPTSGFVELVREEDIIRTNIRVEDAVKMVVSGGRMSPKDISQHLNK
jgi:uncharacterized membrane protein